jgi:aryl-alcohol dehydrogenase-like predicted oxidoreductase
MDLRWLGRSGIKVSPLGLGTARLAGLGWHDESAPQDSAAAQREGVRQIQAAVDLGVTLFDTADNYGQGFSECVLGEALRDRHQGILVVTKFGEDPMPEQADPLALEAATVARKCEASLRRLQVDCLDLYLLHRRDYPLERTPEMVAVLEDLVRAGKIRFYGWSTDDVERARIFARGEHCIAIEHRLNVFNDHPAMLDLCQEQDLASLNRGPLLMGVLTGRWSAETKLEQDDPRAPWFEHQEFLKVLSCVQQIEPFLTHGGRSAVQGALGWIWARSPLTIPLPGFRSLEQMQALVQAQQFGPLPADTMREINERVERAMRD